MDTKKISKRQEELLNYIVGHMREEHMPPTVAEMAKHLKVSSKNAVVKLLRALEKGGFIARDRNARGIKVLDTLGQSLHKGMVKLPVLGDVPAGGPMLAEEHIENWVNLPSTLTEGKKDVFLLRVYGDSMINAGIFNNDLVIVHQTQEVKNSDVVVGLTEDGVTVKRLIKTPGKTYLKAENPKFKDIYPEGEWTVQGKVIGLIRQIH